MVPSRFFFDNHRRFETRCALLVPQPISRPTQPGFSALFGGSAVHEYLTHRNRSVLCRNSFGNRYKILEVYRLSEKTMILFSRLFAECPYGKPTLPENGPKPSCRKSQEIYVETLLLVTDKLHFVPCSCNSQTLLRLPLPD